MKVIIALLVIVAATQAFHDQAEWNNYQTEAEYKKILGSKLRVNDDIQTIWDEWKARYNKEYATPEEEEYRFQIFAEYKKEVDRVNTKYANGEINFTLYLGVFSDLTEDEKIRLLSFNPHMK